MAIDTLFEDEFIRVLANVPASSDEEKEACIAFVEGNKPSLLSRYYLMVP